MKAKFSYELLPKAILRTPHYPGAFLYSLFDDGKVDCMLVSDEFMSMVQIAAPGLYKEMRSKLCNSGIILDKTRVALFKYMERACTRCTPFGAFASLSVVPVGQPYSGVKLRMSIENSLSLDYQFLDAIAHKANRDRIKFLTNDTFYGHGKDMRFLVMGSGLIVKTVRMSQMVNFILVKCRSGLTVAEIVEALMGEFDVDSDCVIELVHNMINEGLLLPESYPRVISRDETKRIIGIVSKDCTQLNEISRIIDDYKRITDPTNQIKIVDEIWDKCSKVVNVKEKNILKLDTFRQIADGTGLNIRCFENILPALEVMARLCNNGVNEALKTFKSRFYNKYEGQEVKLLEALDPEIGIGYGGERMIKAANGLIDGLTLPRQNQGDRRVIAVTSKTTLLHDKLMASIAGDYATVIISDADVSELPSCIGNMPASVAAMGQFVRVNDEACISGLHFCGPSAANLLGRFSENASIKSVVDQICAHEQSHSDDVILAEINHLSSVKVGNILSRDHIRDYELSFLSPGGDAIPLSDVTIRLEKGEIVLRAISIGCKIQPRMTTAHNYRNNTSAVYRFLCDIQSERIVPGLSFMWCGLDALYRRFPRVVYRDIILSPATWYLDTPIKSNNRNIDRQLIIDWAKSNKLPRRVLYIVGDNKLLIDFSCNLSVDSFVSELPKSGIIEIQEYFEPSGYVQDEKNQNYCNEFLIPLLRQS